MFRVGNTFTTWAITWRNNILCSFIKAIFINDICCMEIYEWKTVFLTSIWKSITLITIIMYDINSYPKYIDILKILYNYTFKKVVKHVHWLVGFYWFSYNNNYNLCKSDVSEIKIKLRTKQTYYFHQRQIYNARNGLFIYYFLHA